ncbi:uncharacterized protein LOC128204454 [Mya arenaria]|uniref:uncharacterized protein LOC128204454 n=1 Tax=Mya arenaria TaxID=6604 RepID=UPI0022E3FE3C|nr:uncharacterized protein LOC128204454 [Mya arenaria]
MEENGPNYEYINHPQILHSSEDIFSPENKMSLSTVLLLVVCLTATRFLYIHAAVVFTCDETGLISITTFPSKANKIAIDSSNTVLTIDDSTSGILKIAAGKDAQITVAFSDYDMSTVKAFAGDAEAYSLQCTEIDSTGVSKTVTASAAASISTDLNTVTPTYTVSSRITATNDDATAISSITVGNDFLYVIVVPSVYTISVVSCDAFAHDGSSKVAALSVALLGASGCTSSSNAGGALMSNVALKASTAGTYEATVKAFKFFSQPSVLIECAIKVCPSGSSCAALSTGDCARKRRYVESVDDGSYSMTTRDVIEVIDPFTIGAASVPTVTISAILLSTIASLWASA